MAMLRLFVGLFPPKPLSEALEASMAKWRESVPDPRVRWVPSENLHMTLCFLGNVDDGAVPELESSLRQAVAGQSPGRLGLAGLGTFPTHQRPKVLWAGIEGDLDWIAELQDRLQGAVARFVEKPDFKPFSPHLTLARIKEGDGRLSRAIRRLAKEEVETTFGAWRVAEILLMRSELGSDRSRYSKVLAFPLEPVVQ